MSTASVQRRSRVSRRSASWLGVAAIVVAVVLVQLIGGWVTVSSVRTWYPDVPKPGWTPPGWVFGPVWTVLYLMMAVAASLVWLARERYPVGGPMTAFAVQLAANLAWSVCFFGLRSPLLGFIDICVLWVAVGVTVWQFFRISRTAGWLLVPYWAWVTFAAALNGAILALGG